MALERLWAGWRSEYVAGPEAAAADGGPGGADCVFCRILASSEPDDATLVVARYDGVVVLLNAFPYTSGHLMVIPERHLGEPDELYPGEHDRLWRAVTTASSVLKEAYSSDGINLGANIGQAAGAGVPGHFHVHVLPRWVGDTNFTTTVAATRVMPEALDVSWRKLREAWPPD